MAISFVTATSGGAAVSGINPTLTPLSTTLGDLLLVYSVSLSATTTATAGWTKLVGQTTASSTFLTVHYKYVTSPGEPSVVLAGQTGPNSNTMNFMVVYRGVNNIDAVSALTQYSTGTSLSTATLYARKQNDWIVSAYCRTAQSASAQAWVDVGGTTSRYAKQSAGSSPGALIVDEVQSSIGTSTPRTTVVSTGIVSPAMATTVAIALRWDSEQFLVF